MKRFTILTTVLALLLVSIGIQSASAQSTMRRTFDDLEVDIWTDRDDGSNYYEGDDIWIYFRASQDAYVVVYDLDTRGNVNLIFPEDPSDNHYVEGGEVYMIPNRYADYTLTLEGPPGDEHLQVVASQQFFPIPDWRGPVNVHNEDVWGFDFEGDNQEFISKVNFKYFPQNSAFDQVVFYVAPSHYYEPVESDCYGDCGQVYVDYPNGCEVYVDGVFYGYTPLYVPRAYVGRHRFTIYWGTTIVFNDWIHLSLYDPYFIYPRPYFLYDYYWTHWYRDYHYGYYDYYDYGYGRGQYPSETKYKRRDGRTFYTHNKPSPKRGYRVVQNSHKKYSKSKAYTAAKSKRITTYKSKYGYNKTTKTFTKSKPYSKTGGKYYTPDAIKRGYQGKRTAPGTVRGKKTYNSTNKGTYNPRGKSSSGSRGTYKGGSKSSGGSRGGSYKGGSKSSGGSKGGYKGGSSGGAKSGGSKGGAKSGGAKSGGGKKSGGKRTTGISKPDDSGSKSPGSSYKKSAPRKSGGASKSSGAKTGGSSKSKSASKSKGKSKK